MSRSVLITGCSSGIGRAAAQRLARREDLDVYASARNVDDIAELEADGCRLLALDVTDAGSMQVAVKSVEDTHGRVGALVNNAGYGEYGPVEEVDLDAARRQFETNVFGLARLCQLVLPGMRDAGEGRIVNISSQGGRLTFPGGGWYHASKYAVEALSDAMRFEVSGFGVKVVLVEPGLIRTRFDEVARRTTEENTDRTSPYGRLAEGSNKIVEEAYRSALAAGPDAVARVIERAITARWPLTRYRVTFGARAVITSRKLLPDVLWDAGLGVVFPRPEKD